MIEFFLSKFWMMLFGLALLAAVGGAFSQMNEDIGSLEAQSAAEQISDALYSVFYSPEGSTAILVLEDILSSDCSVTIANGTVLVKWRGEHYPGPGPSNLCFEGSSSAVEGHASDRIRVTSAWIDGERGLHIQLEKVSESS